MPRLERLEFRLVLSAFGASGLGGDGPTFGDPADDGPPAEIFFDPGDEAIAQGDAESPAVVGSEPARGASLAEAPSELSLIFDRPVDPSVLNGSGDLTLERAEADGSWTSVLNPDAPPAEALDESGTRLGLTLDAPLAPGRYRLRLSELASIAGIDGSSLSEEARAASAIEFAIAAPATDSDDAETPAEPLGPGLEDAIEIGTLGPVVVKISGSLDFSEPSRSVALYKITLPEGDSWRLGLEVSAERDGSNLDATLSLFDAEGRLLATAEHGRSDAANDPFLFAGLNPGTYYVGVSGVGHLPGRDGGYDPATRDLGSVPEGAAGGTYTLALVADPAEPTTVVEAALDRLSPTEPVASGFSLRFSGAIVGLDGSARGIEVVDARGAAWPVMVASQNQGEGRVSFLFRRHLPEGSYTVRLPRVGGLVDLAGRAPSATGLADGVLAEFTIEAAPGRDPSDLGPLFPADLLAGVSTSRTAPAGETASITFAVPASGLYRLKLRQSGGAGTIALAAIGGEAARTIESGTDGATISHLIALSAESYTITISAEGSEAVTLELTLENPGFGAESILANGLGQGAALNLRLVSADSPAGFALGGGARSTPTPVGSVANGPSAGPYAESLTSSGREISAGSPKPAAAEAVTAALASRDAAGPALDIGGILVGRPSSDADHVAAVGPAIGAGSYALASAGVGPGQAIAATGSLRGGFSQLADRPEQSEAPAPITDGSGLPETEVKPNPDGIAEAANGPRVAEEVQAVATGEQAANTEAAPAAVPTEGTDRPADEEVEAGSGIMPWVTALIGAAAIGARWIKRRVDARRSKPMIATRRIPAPHTPLVRVRV